MWAKGLETTGPLVFVKKFYKENYNMKSSLLQAGQG
jgi:hypothetical protein